jgi:outer membrane protein assembly factor BamB
LGDRVTGSVVVDAEGTVYAGGQAISPDGVVRWSLPPLDGLGGAGIDMAIGRSGTVYVSSESSGVEALRPDGTVLWSWSGNGGLVALGDDETVYLHPFEQSGFGLAAFSPDGHMLWTKVHPEWFDGAVAVALSGTLYAQHTLPMLSGLGALSPSGASLWVMPSPDWTSSFGPLYPVVAADQVLFVSGASVIAVDPAGQTRWSVSMAEPSIPPAVGVDGMVYVTDRQGSALHAIAADGTVRWTYDTQGRAGTTPILVDGAGTAYLGLAPSTGRVPPFDTVAITRQGTLAWTVPGGGSPLAIGADGTIYTDTGGSLTALRAR